LPGAIVEDRATPDKRQAPPASRADCLQMKAARREPGFTHLLVLRPGKIWGTDGESACSPIVPMHLSVVRMASKKVMRRQRLCVAEGLCGGCHRRGGYHIRAAWGKCFAEKPQLGVPKWTLRHRDPGANASGRCRSAARWTIDFSTSSGLRLAYFTHGSARACSHR
jgi:hypothetical protein